MTGGIAFQLGRAIQAFHFFFGYIGSKTGRLRKEARPLLTTKSKLITLFVKRQSKYYKFFNY